MRNEIIIILGTATGMALFEAINYLPGLRAGNFPIDGYLMGVATTFFVVFAMGGICWLICQGIHLLQRISHKPHHS